MRTPASIAGHPIHPMLVPIPIGLWLFSFACDLIHKFGSGDAEWATVALYTMIGGIVGALLAAAPGFIDFTSLPDEPKKTAGIHMTINLVIVALFAANAWWRISSGNASDAGMNGPLWLSLVSVLMLAVSGWLGGHLVYKKGVAVNVDEAAAKRRT